MTVLATNRAAVAVARAATMRMAAGSSALVRGGRVRAVVTGSGGGLAGECSVHAGAAGVAVTLGRWDVVLAPLEGDLFHGLGGLAAEAVVGGGLEGLGERLHLCLVFRGVGRWASHGGSLGLLTGVQGGIIDAFGLGALGYGLDVVGELVSVGSVGREEVGCGYSVCKGLVDYQLVGWVGRNVVGCPQVRAGAVGGLVAVSVWQVVDDDAGDGVFGYRGC